MAAREGYYDIESLIFLKYSTYQGTKGFIRVFFLWGAWFQKFDSYPGWFHIKKTFAEFGVNIGWSYSHEKGV